MPRRRKLSFSTVDDVLPDLDRLLRDGHVTVGRWSLAQICQHLAGALRLSMDGFPHKAPRWFRRSAGPAMRVACLTTGRMPRGFPIFRAYLPTHLPHLDLTEQAAALRAEVERFHTFKGTFAEHPLFGRLTRDQMSRYQCVHCAHHLSFAVPNDLAR